ncbi:MAG: right-handed parallel beta-helix repeat-containing protein [Candidatus Accumulibacter phosphatis]
MAQIRMLKPFKGYGEDTLQDFGATENARLVSIGFASSDLDGPDGESVQRQANLASELAALGVVSNVINAASITGVDITGATDSTSAINSALATLLPGTVVEFPSGLYVAAIRVTVPNTRITGSPNATIKTPFGATSHVNDACIRLLADGCTIENISLDGNKGGNPLIDDFDLGRWADGVAIYANNATVRNCRIKDTIGHKIIVWNESFDPTSTAKGARTKFAIENNYITGIGQRAAIDVASTDVTAGVSNNGIIRGNYVDSNVVIVHTGEDLLIEGNVLQDTTLSGGGLGIHTGSKRIRAVNNLVGPSSAGITTYNGCEDITIAGNKISSTVGYGISADACTRAFIADNTVNATGAGAQCIKLNAVIGGYVCDNVLSNSGGHSISVEGSSSNVVVSGNKSYSPTSYHINLSTTSDITIRGNSLSAGQIGIAVTSGVNSNIVVESNDIRNTTLNGIYVLSTDAIIKDNIIKSAGSHAIRFANSGTRVVGNDIATVTGIGVYLTAAVAGVSIVDNRISGTSGAAISGIQADTIVARNVGYVTEAKGTTSIADTQSTAVVTHGLASTPSVVTATPRGNETIWVSDRSSTTFTVSRAGTSGVLAFDWQAS